MLKLTITSYQRLSPDQETERVLRPNDAPLIVGRAADCGWSIVDMNRILSGRHCSFELTKDGRCRVTDLSTNGVFINGEPAPLGRHMSRDLGPGDKVRLGDYEIEIGEARQPVPTSAGISQPAGKAPLPGGAGAPAVLQAAQEPSLSDLLSDPPRKTAQAPEGLDPARDAVDLPKAQDAPLIPTDWRSRPGETGGDAAAPGLAPKGPAPKDIKKTIPAGPASPQEPAAPQPKPPLDKPRPAQPAPPTGPVPADGQAAAAFLAGLGLRGQAAVSGVDMESWGRVTRAAVEGLVELLAARAAIKNAAGLEQTLIGRDRNNPLKFSPNVDAALTLMSEAAARPGYLGAAESVEEAVGDLKAHEMAVLTAIRATLTDVLQRLDPAQIEADAGERAGLVKSKKAAAWEAYQQAYADLQRLIGDDILRGLSQSFGKAYNREIDRLRSR